MATHFSPEALKFLRGLARHNDRAWFDPRKEIYERELKAPMLALIGEVNDALVSIAPDHIRDPRKTMLRIYRDTRFSSDKRPYKAHVSAWWVRNGLPKTSGAGFYFHISPKGTIIAVGCYMPMPDQLLAIRRHLLEHHVEMRALLNNRKLRAALPEMESNPLKRPPRGFPAEHPALDLILYRQWGLSATLPPDLATSPTLTKEIVRRFTLAAPLVQLLNAPLANAKSPRSRVPESLID